MISNRYAKGSRAEHELMDHLSGKGYSVIRAAGSGVAGDCPDVLAFRAGRNFAFECKAWDSGRVALEKDKFEVLQSWQENTGISTYLAWKMPRDGWFILPLSSLEEKEASFSITEEKARTKSFRLDELV